MAEDVESPSDAELGDMPVFPLPELVVFPGTPVPLHFFEPRYRAMIEDLVASGSPWIATVRLAPGWEGDYHGSPALRPIGTVCRLVAHRRKPDGTHDVVMRGVARARLVERAPSPRGYRRVAAHRLADEDEPRVTRTEVTTLLSAAATVATRLRKEHPEFRLGVEGDERPGRMLDVLADRLVAAADDRQAVLEALDVPHRLELVLDAIGDILVRIGAIDGPMA